MRRALTDNEIHEILQKGCYGHLGCIDGGQPLVIPITYVYDAHAIFSFSFEGGKIAAMRKNPAVCFQVEQLHGTDGWRSVMIWGTFEEVQGDERDGAYSLILERLWKESSRDHPLFLPFRHSAQTLEAAKNGTGVVLYRIGIAKQTGIMEQYE